MKKKNQRSAQSGSAYIVVLLVLLLLTIFGLSLVVITHTERQIGANEKDASRNFFAAESGIAVVAAWLQDNNNNPHRLEVGSRSLGTSSTTSSLAATPAVVFKDVVQTTRAGIVGNQASNLGDVSSNSGGKQGRVNFRFESNARRISESASGVLEGREVQLGQKRIEVMIEMDPFEPSAGLAWDGQPITYE